MVCIRSWPWTVCSLVMIVSVRYVEVLQRTSASVIIDVTFHQDQHFKLNRTSIPELVQLWRVCPLQRTVAPLACRRVLILISHLTRGNVLTLFRFFKEILCVPESSSLGICCISKKELKERSDESSCPWSNTPVTLFLDSFYNSFCAYIYFHFSYNMCNIHIK